MMFNVIIYFKNVFKQTERERFIAFLIFIFFAGFCPTRLGSTEFDKIR